MTGNTESQPVLPALGQYVKEFSANFRAERADERRERERVPQY